MTGILILIGSLICLKEESQWTGYLFSVYFKIGFLNSRLPNGQMLNRWLSEKNNLSVVRLRFQGAKKEASVPEADKKRVEICVVLGCVLNFMMCSKGIYTGLIRTEIGNWNSDGYFH